MTPRAKPFAAPRASCDFAGIAGEGALKHSVTALAIAFGGLAALILLFVVYSAVWGFD
jgi:hypothetical protein